MLAVQGLLPVRWHRFVASLLVVIEIVAGSTALVGVVAGWPAGFLPMLVTYLGFAAYTAILLRVRPAAPCGCFDDEAATPIVVVRSGSFAVISTAAALGEVPTSVASLPLAIAGSLAIAAIARLLPTALVRPAHIPREA